MAAKLANKQILCYLLKLQRVEKDAIDQVGVDINSIVALDVSLFH